MFFFIKILNVCHIINQIYNIVLMFFTLNDLSLFLIKLITRTCLMLLLQYGEKRTPVANANIYFKVLSVVVHQN